MKIRLNIGYLFAFIVVYIIELIIGLFINDNFIRPYMGDVLIVVLIYFFIKSFVDVKTKFLPLFIFIFAVLVELGQYFNLAGLLGLNDYKIAKIIIGSTFDIKDVVCYFAGCTGLFLFEMKNLK